MRLDQFLVASRIVKRRSVAQELCEKGRVYLNGTIAKSSKGTKPTDEIQLRRRNEILTIRVLKLPLTKQVSKGDAGALFEIISIETKEEEI